MFKFSALALVFFVSTASAFTPTLINTHRRAGILGAVCAERSEVLRPFENGVALKVMLLGLSVFNDICEVGPLCLDLELGMNF